MAGWSLNRLTFLPLLGLVAAPAVRATIITGTGQTSNITSPANFSYWNNIGYVPSGNSTGGSGVYLGDGWVLTAGHVQGGVNDGYTFVIPKLDNGADATFSPVFASQIPMRGLAGGFADVTLFKLQDSPLLHTLPNVQFGAAPQVNSSILMTGAGYNRDATLRYWKLADPNNPDTTTWTDVTATNKASAQRRGYLYDPTGFAKRWGTNKTVTMPGGGATFSFNSTVLFGATFDEGVANEAQGAPGDSGGGVFANNRLVGINLYIGDDRGETAGLGQPANSAVYGNATFFANLYSYVDQIAAATKFHPSIDGDANLDGNVDAADFAIFYENYQAGTGTKWTEGDFNLDGKVDFLDFQKLELNYGYNSTTATAGEATAGVQGVPEPAGGIVVAGLAAVLGLRRRRR